MTREEYLALREKVEGGEIDYDSLTKEQKQEYRAAGLENKKIQADNDPMFVAMFGKATDENNLRIYSQKGVPQFTAHSNTEIIYPKKNEGAKKAAKEIKKNRKKAIEKTTKHYSKKRKKEKKAKKRAEEKQAKKIFKHLPKEEQIAYSLYAERNSNRKAIKKIIADAKLKEEKEREIEDWWSQWCSFHEYDEDNKKDRKVLEAAVNREVSPMESFLDKKRNDPMGDKSKVFGKWLKPVLPIRKTDEEFYERSVFIKTYDWDEYRKYLSTKKIKSVSDIVKYRQKFNMKKLFAQYKSSRVPKAARNRPDAYLYTPLECRDLVGVREELDRRIKNRDAEKQRKAEILAFVKGNIAENSPLYRNLRNHDNMMDEMVKVAEDAFERAFNAEKFPEEPPVAPYMLNVNMDEPIVF